MELACNTCNETFTAKRSDAKYCSPRCRTHASRDRNQPDRPKRPRPSLPGQFLSKIVAMTETTDELHYLTQDVRFSRHRHELGEVYGNDLRRHIASLEAVLSELE